MKQNAKFGMRRTALKAVVIISALVALGFTTVVSKAADPLPSWNDGPAKQSIIAFVEKVTNPGSPEFVPVPERIATFDNDGTLWCEQPMPVQLYFALDRVKALAPQHPEWKTREPFASLLKGDLQKAMAGGDHALLEIVMATHAGMTTAEFEQTVKDWIATAKHPKTGQLYTDMVYQPMLEVLSYLTRQRLQELHRLGRRHRVHAAVGGEDLWHSARTGCRQQHQDEVRNARRKTRSRALAGNQLQ